MCVLRIEDLDWDTRIRETEVLDREMPLGLLALMRSCNCKDPRAI